ncbi:MAG: hypothetical protein AAF480_10130 [Actinomycetota bacterium]
MGLIARQLEAAGIPTVSLTSARDITAAANPPRAVFLDYPLGHTSGRVGEPELNRRIVTAALEALALDEPGVIVDLPHVWADTDDWKDGVMQVRTSSSGETSTEDDRVARHDTPQYQTDDDAAAAATSHDGEDCLVCAGIDY